MTTARSGAESAKAASIRCTAIESVMSRSPEPSAVTATPAAVAAATTSVPSCPYAPVTRMREAALTSAVDRRAGLQRLPPVPVVPVPGDRVRQSLIERHLRLVAQLATDLAVVDRVAQVVPAASGVDDPLDERLVPPGGGHQL